MGAPRGLGGHERARRALHGDYIGEPPAPVTGRDPRLFRREAAGRLPAFYEKRAQRISLRVVLLRLLRRVDADELQVSRTVPVPVHARVEATVALARLPRGVACIGEPRDPAVDVRAARG